MALDKWFNGLVLGGAALAVAGCGDAEPDGSGAGGQGGETTASSTGAGQGGTSASGSSVGGAGAGGETGSGGAGGEIGSGGAQSGAGGGLPEGCSSPPDPSDPCGCPCCWAEGLNTEPVCASFCESGNNGQGCCM